MWEHDCLILHDNHFSMRDGCPRFETTTFHLFLHGFNGKAHITSPSLDWRDGVCEINIDGVVVRPRRGYGRAKDFYKSFFLNSFRAFVDIYRILKDYRAIVIAGPCCSAPYAHLAAWIQRKPVIGYVIGDNREVVKHSKEYAGIQKCFANLIARWEWAAMEMLAKTHKVIALGPDLAKSLSKYSGNVSLGFSSLIRDEQITSSKPFPQIPTLRLLSVCRLSQEKGLEWALKAMSILEKQGCNFEYIVVGDGHEKKKLISLASSLGLSARVKFSGVIPFKDIDAYYQSADIFILPSYSEGVAKVLLEAMAARSVVIATGVGGNTWVLDKGTRGYVVPPQNDIAIAEAIFDCVDNKNERDSRLENATEFIRMNTMEAAARKIQDVIDLEIRNQGRD